MGVIKNIRIELIFFSLVFISIFLSINIDVGLYFYFSNLNYGSGAVYLIEFFKKITELGNSFWYFALFILSLPLLFFLNKLKSINGDNYQFVKNFCLSGIIYLSTTGIVTQIIKHVVGRIRPNYINSVDGFGFDFFSTNSNFHSFPSGHASTIFIISLLLGSLLPKIRYFLYGVAIIIAISRVVVGAHFATDIVAGILVAIIVFKILNIFFQKKYNFLKPKPINYKKNNMLGNHFVGFVIVGILLAVGPTFDLFFSNLFYFDNKQFLLQSTSITTIVFRDVLLPISLIYILFLPIISTKLPIKKIFFDYDFSIRSIVYVWISLVFNLIIVINVFLKGFWGRARPNDIIQLGGGDSFTPWYKLSEACTNNCSFVSGDAAVGFSFLILFFITKKSFYFYLALVFGFFLGLVRIAEGGHFLSDIIFSFLITAATTVCVFYFYGKKNVN